MWKPDYATKSELANYIEDNTSEDDSLYAMYVTTASRAVDDFCGRQFGQVDAPEARTYCGTWDRAKCTYYVEIDDLQDPTGLAVEDKNGDAVTEFTLLPYNAVLKGKPYERIVLATPGTLIITALWGWTAVPSAVKNATLIQAARLAKRRGSPFGVAGSPQQGSELRLLAALDPDLKTSLGNTYRRNWWAA